MGKDTSTVNYYVISAKLLLRVGGLNDELRMTNDVDMVNYETKYLRNLRDLPACA